MSSFECNNSNHSFVNGLNPFHKDSDDNIIKCIKTDRIPFVYKQYCSKCFEFEGYNMCYEIRCFLCSRKMNRICFTDKNQTHNYCFDCLNFSPDEVWPYASDENMVREIGFILKDKPYYYQNEKKDLKFNLFDIVDLMEEYRGVYELKLWQNLIDGRIDDIRSEYEEKRLKEKIKNDMEKYTLLSKIEDKFMKFIPKLTVMEARYASKKIDLSSTSIREVDDIDDAEEFLNWLIYIKSIH